MNEDVNKTLIKENKTYVHVNGVENLIGNRQACITTTYIYTQLCIDKETRSQES